MLFEVRAANQSAQLATLLVDASTEAEARQRTLQQHCTPISVKVRAGGSTRSQPAFNVALFAEELRMLLGAGLSLIDAIEGLTERQANNQTRATLSTLASRLRQGERLSSATAGQPEVFPPLFVGILRAAETTSNLPSALAKFVAYDTHLRTLRERLAAAAIYPIILLAVGASVTLFLMAYVVPRFASVYRSSGRSLPWASRLLLEAGHLLNEHLVFVGAVGLLALLLAWMKLRPHWHASGWMQVIAQLPGAARHIATIEVSRLFRTLGMLLEGGLPVREALALSSAVMFGPRGAALASVVSAVEGGLPLSEGLQAAGLSTPLAQRLIQVGERSGQLGPMLERAAEFHEHETALWIERFSKTLGPVLMVAISLVVGSIVIFLYIPIFDLASSLQ